jgi:hypothetical protein
VVTVGAGALRVIDDRQRSEARHGLRQSANL